MSVHVLRAFVLGAYYRTLENRCLRKPPKYHFCGRSNKQHQRGPTAARPGCQVKCAPWGIVPSREDACWFPRIVPWKTACGQFAYTPPKNNCQAGVFLLGCRWAGADGMRTRPPHPQGIGLKRDSSAPSATVCPSMVMCCHPQRHER